MQKGKQDGLLLILCTAVLFILVIFLCTGIFLYGSLSDLDAEVRYALEVIRSGEFFPPEYVSGSDLFIYGRNIIMTPILLFTTNELFAVSAASIIMLVPAVLAVIYCSRKIMKNNTWLMAIPLLFCGISSDWNLMYTSMSSYMLQFLALLLVITLYVDSVDDDYKVKSKIKFAFLVFFILYMGLGGVRGLQVYGLPLIGTIVISFWYKHIKDSFFDALKNSGKCIGLLAALCACMIAAFLCSQFLLKRLNCPSGDAGIYFSDLDFFQRLKDLYNAFILVCGITYGVPMFSVDGIINFVKIVLSIILFIILPILQIKNFKHETKEMQLFIIYACIHFLEMALITVFTTALIVPAPRYLLTIMYLLVLLSTHYLYKKVSQMPFNHLLTVTVNCVFSVYILICSGQKALSCKDYDEKLAQTRSVTNYLISEDLTWGYATYWYAGWNSLLSNREVSIHSVVVSDYIAGYPWLASKYNYTPEAYEGTTFLMVDAAENEAFTSGNSYALLGEPIRILNYDNFWIYVYDYNISLNNFGGKDSM